LLGTVGPGVSVTWKPAGGSHGVYASASGTSSGCPVAYSSPSVSFSVDGGPSVSLSAPPSATAPAKIALSASVTSAYSISSVSYYLSNGTLLGTATTAPYSFTWAGGTQGNATGVGPGSYSIVAKATDVYGAVGTSATSTVTVAGAAAPAVNVSVSASRAMLPATLTINASANDPYTIASLALSVNGTTCASASANSVSCTLSVPLSGSNVGTTTSYTIQASASDYWGGAATSSTSITETGHAPPTATVNSAEATWLNSGDPEVVAVTAAASDVDGIASIALLLNGSTVATLTQPPYNFQVTGFAAGTYSVAVQATNTVGQQTLSAAQNVTVAAAPAVSGDPKSQTRTTEFEYDANTGKMTKKLIESWSSDLCLVQTYTPDAAGNPHTVTTRNCNGSDASEAPAPTDLSYFPPITTTVTYDPTETYPQKFTNALNQTTTINEEPRFGTVLTQIDPNNVESQQGANSPDSFGRITQVIAPDSTQTNTQYLWCSGVYTGTTTCPTNAVTAVQVSTLNGTTQVAPTKTTFYDVLGRVVETQTQGFDGTTIVQDTIYDNLGRVYQVSQPYFAGKSPVYTTNTYDTLGRVLASTDANNGVTKYSYNGLETSATDANGNATTKTMNGQYQVIAVIDAMDQVMSYSYDPFGNLIETMDATGAIKSYLYDIRGRKTQTADPDVGTWIYVYNSLSQLRQQTDGKSQVSSMTYDPLGRITSHTEGDLTSNWEYDTPRSECPTGTNAAIGQLDRAWTSAGSTYSRIECYDSLERPVQERTQIGGKNYVAEVSYDTVGRLANQTYPAGYVYPGGFTTKYNYNNYGYLNQIVNNSNGSVIWQANTLDAMGNITSDSMAAGALANSRTYDVLGRLHIAQAGNGNTIQNDTFDYDSVGNLHDRSWIDSSAVSHSEAFGYDQLNRLTSVSGPANKTVFYDGAGNLTYKSDIGTYSYTAGTHRIASIAGTVYGVANPNFSYDNNGNITAEAGLSASWTTFNMPSLMTRGSNSSSFTYGPEHQRITQVATSSGGTVTTNYVGSSFEQVATSSTGITENHDYIGAYGRRVAMLVDTSNATTSWRYFHQDHLSTIEVVTDQNGALVERLSYDAWGKRRNLDGTDSATPIGAIDKRGYTDQEELDGIGLVHMNGRVYDPVIARFTSPDPIIQTAYDPQAHNRYAYASNRPLRFVDPTGFDDIDSAFSYASNGLSCSGSCGVLGGNVAIPDGGGWGDLSTGYVDSVTINGDGTFTITFNGQAGDFAGSSVTVGTPTFSNPDTTTGGSVTALAGGLSGLSALTGGQEMQPPQGSNAYGQQLTTIAENGIQQPLSDAPPASATTPSDPSIPKVEVTGQRQVAGGLAIEGIFGLGPIGAAVIVEGGVTNHGLFFLRLTGGLGFGIGFGAAVAVGPRGTVGETAMKTTGNNPDSGKILFGGFATPRGGIVGSGEKSSEGGVGFPVPEEVGRVGFALGLFGGVYYGDYGSVAVANHP